MSTSATSSTTFRAERFAAALSLEPLEPRAPHSRDPQEREGPSNHQPERQGAAPSNYGGVLGDETHRNDEQRSDFQVNGGTTGRSCSASAYGRWGAGWEGDKGEHYPSPRCRLLPSVVRTYCSVRSFHHTPPLAAARVNGRKRLLSWPATGMQASSFSIPHISQSHHMLTTLQAPAHGPFVSRVRTDLLRVILTATGEAAERHSVVGSRPAHSGGEMSLGLRDRRGSRVCGGNTADAVPWETPHATYKGSGMGRTCKTADASQGGAS